MAFHLGKPILVMILCATAAGVTSRLTQQSDARADLEMWAFSEQNFKSLTGVNRPAGTQSLEQLAESRLGRSVVIKLVQYRALSTRLSGLFMSNAKGTDLPDVVDVEIGSVGRYFRPPIDEIGLLPLNDLIEKRGWRGKILETRFAPWSKGGVIFGIPQDVHPTTIAYDEQDFRAAGVDLASSQTWEQFHDNCLKFQAYWNKPGQKSRWAFEMGESNASTLVTMLLQRGINLVDQNENVHLTNPQTLDTLVRYIRMLVGPRKIGGGTGLGNEAFSQDLRAGYVSAFFCPDWRVGYMKNNVPTNYYGRMRLMPLPAWPDSPYRTSTAGGSMVAIPRNATDPETSFKLIETLYLGPEAIAARSGTNYVLPAVKAAWENPKFDEPDPFFGGQPVRRLIANLAAGVPPRYVSPASTVAEVELAMVLIEALDYAKSLESVEDDRLLIKCRELLADAETRLKRQVAHGRFGE